MKKQPHGKPAEIRKFHEAAFLEAEQSKTFLLSAKLRNGIQQLLCILPAKTWVSDRFAIYMVRADFLTALYQIAFNHNAFYQFLNVRRHQTAVKDFFYNTNLFFVLLARVRVVGIDDYRWIFQFSLIVHLQQKL